MIRVCFAGVTGRTAEPILAALEAADDLDLVAGVARSAAGRRLSEVTGSTSSALVHGSVREALSAERFDVLVDFTSAAAVRGNVWSAVAAGRHVVVGSSGLTATDYAELDVLAREQGVGVVAAGSFSVQAALLQHFSGVAARFFDSWEVLDYASSEKVDAPSGTARQLAESLGTVRPPRPAVPLEDLHGMVESRGAEVAGTRVHSVRLPGFSVSTEVVFGATGERLTLRHDTFGSPLPYVSGTLLAVRRVAESPGVRLGLDSLLFG